MSESSIPYKTGPGRLVKCRPVQKKAVSTPYGRGCYGPAPNGRGFDCSISARGFRVRARIPDEMSARAWIDAQETALKLDRPPLSRAQLLDAQDALAELPPGATLLEAARLWRSLRAPGPAARPRDASLSLALETFLSATTAPCPVPETAGRFLTSHPKKSVP